eukprot:Gregarina_sp_Poly_1__11051@NODE_886_length_5840_cov_23_566603_g633_i0_p4_GENE_NODE_886_length_5840_cov_23_566603_g633_i0NODE_886_length_5840_cov_23_566603_g633_i0_p4_ORF_typecomplete_len320_score10_94DUF938/PF06080_12/0_19_NODE_886_length_5840_cov_23_566603_g633_i01631122
MCRPCMKPCFKVCQHRKCSNKCSEICIPCVAGCTNGCIHRKCRQRCGQVCDVEPCTTACRKLLPCRHPCCGMCGDICPTLCKRCHYSEYQRMFKGFPKIVQLQDCFHILPVDAVDSLIERYSQTLKEWPACPLCYCPIRRSLRYQKTLNKFHLALNKQKFAIISWGTRQQPTIGIQVRDLLQEISRALSLPSEICFSLAATTQGLELIWSRHTFELCDALGKLLQEHCLHQSDSSTSKVAIFGILRQWYQTGQICVSQLLKICLTFKALNQSSHCSALLRQFPEDWRLSQCRSYIGPINDDPAKYIEVEKVIKELRNPD